jgi:hypothetical protein
VAVAGPAAWWPCQQLRWFASGEGLGAIRLGSATGMAQCLPGGSSQGLWPPVVKSMAGSSFVAVNATAGRFIAVT